EDAPLVEDRGDVLEGQRSHFDGCPARRRHPTTLRIASTTASGVKSCACTDVVPAASLCVRNHGRGYDHLPMTDLTSLIRDLVRIDSVNPALDPARQGESELAHFVADWATARDL